MNSDIPKILHPVSGKPMIHYVIELARKLGSLKIYIVLGFKNEIVRKSLDRHVEIVIQKELLGTADAVRRAAGHFRNYKGDILILSGDAPLLTQQTVKELIKKHRQAKAGCTFLTSEPQDVRGYGRIVRTGRGEVLAIREEKDATAEERNIREINVGVYCFESTILFKAIQAIKMNDKKKEFYLTDIIALLVERQIPVQTVKTEDYTEGIGVNTKQDLAFVESIVRKRILRKFMSEGITIIDPHTTYIDSNVKIGRDTVIRPFTVIENNVRIGNRCKIGPFSHIRPGTNIADEAEIGNFTEVSRTHIGPQSLMKHFSFLGDARVGAKVNIGAGTVTANFDGKNKNVTIIRDDAFIGSDSVLIAPVKVGKQAVTGAGSVVTRGTSIPDGDIAMGVPARIISRRKR